MDRGSIVILFPGKKQKNWGSGLHDCGEFCGLYMAETPRADSFMGFRLSGGSGACARDWHGAQ